MKKKREKILSNKPIKKIHHQKKRDSYMWYDDDYASRAFLLLLFESLSLSLSLCVCVL